MNKIEIERKFRPENKDFKFLYENGRLINTQSIKDVIYDDAGLSLIISGKKIRKRTIDSGQPEWQLKESRDREIGNLDKNIEYGEQYIRDLLKLGKGPMEEELEIKGYIPLCELITFRSIFEVQESKIKEIFTIVIDNVSVEDPNWKDRFGEVELILDSDSSDDIIRKAEQKINWFVSKHNFNYKNVQGKLFEFFKKGKPHYFKLLVKAGLVEEGSKL